MTVKVLDVYDQERGCGFRVPGGCYLTAPALSNPCGLLPKKLEECSACGHAIKLTRGLQKIDVQRLFQDDRCSDPKESCRMCLINRTKMGYLIGVGSRFYKSADAFKREAIEQGISKRIAQIPRDLEVGKTVILIGHPKVFSDLVPEQAKNVPAEIDDDAEQPGPPMIDGYTETTGRMVAKDVAGVIAAFVPQRIEYILRGNETEDELERLARRGLTIVRVHRVQDKQLTLG